MTINALNPYLNFDGNAREVIAFYETALGARTHGDIMRFDQAPGIESTPENKQRVMHAELRIGDAVLMLSDSMPGREVKPGGNVQVVLHFSDVDDLNRKFAALSAGASVTMPVHDAFFGAKFGMLTDRFGVQWMLICQP